MRRSKAFWQVTTALGLSIAVHFTVLAMNPERPVIIQATGESDVLVDAFGNSFADLAAGVETPEPVTDAPIEPTPPVESLPDPTDPTVVEPVDPPASEQPSEVETTQPNAQTPIETAEPASSTDVLDPQVTMQSPTDAQMSQSVPVDNPAVQPVETELASVMTPQEISPLAALAPAEPTDVVQSEDVTPDFPPVAVDRPKAEAQAARATARQQERREAVPAPRPRPASRPPPGNADVNTQRGDPDRPSRPQRAQTPRTGPAQPAPTRGNAAAISNYPGQVYRRIQHLRQRRVAEKGTVRIQIRISKSGGLGSIRVVASSGSRRIDQAALDHVRRAAPFPRPPAGAQTTFVVPIAFR